MIRLLVPPTLALLLVPLGLGCAGNTTAVSEGTPPPPKVTEAVSEPVSEPVPVQAAVPQPEPEAEAAAAPAVVEVPVSQDAGSLDTVFFDYDSSVLTPEALRLLDRHAEWLQENREVTATIEGHCDERGTDEYNLTLGERRATVAKEYLVAQGITPARLAVVSYGEQRPATDGHDETAWEKNRRVEFR